VVARIPRRAEIWSYLPTIAGRDKPSSIAGDRVLVVSNTDANASLPTVIGLTIVTGEAAATIPAAAREHAIPFSEADPMPGAAVIVYRPKMIFREWLTDPTGMVSTPTMRQVFAAMVNYFDE
jgi:hypothetical protein